MMAPSAPAHNVAAPPETDGFTALHISHHRAPMAAGTLVPIARYVDWITTTPILMYELSHLAHASTADTLMLVGSDILMISSGILSACLDRQRQNRMMLFYFANSCVFFVIMLCIINIRVGNGIVLQQTDSVQELFGYLKVRHQLFAKYRE